MKLLNGTLLNFFSVITTISFGTLAAWPTWLAQKQIDKEQTKYINKEIIYIMQLLAYAATKVAAQLGTAALNFALQNPKLSLGLAGGTYAYAHRQSISNWCKQKYENAAPHAKKIILGTSGISAAAFLLKQFLDTYASQQQTNKIFVPSSAPTTINKDYSPLAVPAQDSVCSIPSVAIPAHSILSGKDLREFNDVFEKVSAPASEKSGDAPAHLPQDKAIQLQAVANFSKPCSDIISDNAQEAQKKLKNRCTIMQGAPFSTNQPLILKSIPQSYNEFASQKNYEEPLLVPDTEQLLISLRRANILLEHCRKL